MYVFFSSGRYYINETYKNWWTANDANEFETKEQCFLKYYRNQTAGPYNVDGEDKTVISSLFLVY